MSNATKLPTLSEVTYFQWRRKGAPRPTIDSSLGASLSNDVVKFSTPPKHPDGTIVTQAFEFGIRKANGWVERCFCPAGALSADGLTATGVIRGLDPAGLDYTSGDEEFADEHDQGEPVFCSISPILPSLLISALQGSIASGGNSFIIGVDSSGTVTVKRSTGAGTSVGFLRWSSLNSKVEYSNNGSVWNAIDDTVASVLAKVSSGDTTPGYLEDKIVAGLGILITKLNSGANESLSISANGLLADIITDITVTATQINTAVNAYAALSTYFVAVGNYPGGGVKTLGVLGETVSASDITNNRVLMYQGDDMAWYKIDSTVANWNKPLGLCLEAGTAGQTKNILLRGDVTGQNFSNINPSFSNTTETGDIVFGQTAANHTVAIRLNNSNGAECTLTGSSGNTVSIKNAAGSPTTDVNVRFFLGSATKPYAFYNGTNVVGLQLASGTISKLLTSGTYQNLAFTFTSFKIPAGSYVWVVFERGTVDNVNYYSIQGSSSAALNETGTGTWSGGPGAARMTIGVTSTSPIGYAVKAYDAVAATNGTYNVFNRLAGRQIGRVVSATQMYFDPGQFSAFCTEAENITVDATAAATNHLSTISPGFRVTRAKFHVGSKDATTNNPLKISSGYFSPANTDELVLGNGIYGLINTTTVTGATSYTYDAGATVGRGVWPLENGAYIGVAYPSPAAAGAASPINFYETIELFKQ